MPSTHVKVEKGAVHFAYHLVAHSPAAQNRLQAIVAQEVDDAFDLFDVPHSESVDSDTESSVWLDTSLGAASQEGDQR